MNFHQLNASLLNKSIVIIIIIFTHSKLLMEVSLQNNIVQHNCL